MVPFLLNPHQGRVAMYNVCFIKEISSLTCQTVHSKVLSPVRLKNQELRKTLAVNRYTLHPLDNEL